nr:unnamed protein product [Callosobruchus chinensis]
MGIMLVYDITNEKSFENIKNWIRNIEENASADVEKMLLGNIITSVYYSTYTVLRYTTFCRRS